MEQLCTCMFVSSDKIHELLGCRSYVCNWSFNLLSFLEQSKLVSAKWAVRSTHTHCWKRIINWNTVCRPSLKSKNTYTQGHGLLENQVRVSVWLNIFINNGKGDPREMCLSNLQIARTWSQLVSRVTESWFKMIFTDCKDRLSSILVVASYVPGSKLHVLLTSANSVKWVNGQFT